MFLSKYTPFNITLLPPQVFIPKIAQFLHSRWPRSFCHAEISQLNDADQATFYNCLLWMQKIYSEQGKSELANSIELIVNDLAYYFTEVLCDLNFQIPFNKNPIVAFTWVETLMRIINLGYSKEILQKLDFLAAHRAVGAYLQNDLDYTYYMMEYREFLNYCRRKTVKEVLTEVLHLKEDDIFKARGEVYENIDIVLHSQVSSAMDEYHIRRWDPDAIEWAEALGIAPKTALPIDLHHLGESISRKVRWLNDFDRSLSIFDRWIDALNTLSHEDPVWWPYTEDLILDMDSMLKIISQSSIPSPKSNKRITGIRIGRT